MERVSLVVAREFPPPLCLSACLLRVRLRGLRSRSSRGAVLGPGRVGQVHGMQDPFGRLGVGPDSQHANWLWLPLENESRRARKLCCRLQPYAPLPRRDEPGEEGGG